MLGKRLAHRFLGRSPVPNLTFKLNWVGTSPQGFPIAGGQGRTPDFPPASRQSNHSGYGGLLHIYPMPYTRKALEALM